MPHPSSRSLILFLVTVLGMVLSTMLVPAAAVADGDHQKPGEPRVLAPRATAHRAPVPAQSDLGNVAGQDLSFCRDNTLPANDDNSAGPVDIPFALTFFGQPYTQLWVNNNGNVTFNGPLSTYTPSDITGDTGLPIIAPFFADVDTRGTGSSQVTYGSSPDGSTFCVNWADVGYYSSHVDKLNTFQLLLTKNDLGEGRVAGDFDITFNYDRILWETGDASSGSGGFGGTSATAGFSAGTGAAGTFVQLPGSLTNGALLDGGPDALVSGFQGSIQPGRYVFQVRNSGIAATLGGLHGDVTDSDSNAVGGAYVQACRTTGSFCRTTSTDSGGHYAFTALPVGDYALSVSPPSGSPLFPGAGSGSVTAGGDTAVAVIILQAPRPMPSGVTLSNADPNSGLIDPYVPESGPPVVHYMADLLFAFDGCPGVADPTVTETVGGATVFTGPLTEDPAGHYSATIPRSYPAHGDGTITTNVPLTCDPGATPVAFDIYIDPSGVVTDQYGRPLEGAVVQLQRADAGSGPFTAVPDGSAVMSPANRTNPVTTDATGFFQWDVLTGWYQVAASRTGCTDTASDPMEIPPARLDLLVKMTCASVDMPVPTTLPVLGGTAQVGQTLTATAGVWPSGLVFEKVEWRRGGSVVGTGASYVATPADEGSQLVARVYAKRPDYTQENGVGGVVTFDPATYDLTSETVAPVPVVEVVNPTNTAVPAISGVAKVGRTLTASHGSWDAADLTYAYQWLRDGAAIPGATGADYDVVADDLGSALRVRVTASNTGGGSGTAQSDPVVIGLGDAPQATAPPVITGDPGPGAQLTVTDGSWDLTGLQFAYQWLRDGDPITGATTSTYQITGADLGSDLSAVVTASRAGYADGSATADPVSVPAPEPVASSTRAGLRSSVVEPGKHARLVVQVERADGEVATGRVEVRIDGRTARTVRLQAADDGLLMIRLPKLSPGRYRVRAVYLGTEQVSPSRSAVLRLRVKEPRRGGQHRAVVAPAVRLPALF